MANPEATSKPAANSNMETRHAPPSGMFTAESREARYVVYVPASHTLEDALEPTYWAHHARKMVPMTHVTLMDENRTWEASLRVLAHGPAWAKVVLLDHYVYADAAGKDDGASDRLKARYRIEKAGRNGWRVVTPDNQELVSGLTTEAEAQKHLDDHIASLSTVAAA